MRFVKGLANYIEIMTLTILASNVSESFILALEVWFESQKQETYANPMCQKNSTSPSPAGHKNK